MSNTPTKMLDAVHVELLSDMQKLRAEVKQFSDEVPTLYQAIKKDVDESADKVQETFKDFESLSQAIALHINKSREKSMGEIEAANKENANHITKSLAPYTKYFWLLIGLTGITFVLQLALFLTIAFLR